MAMAVWSAQVGKKQLVSIFLIATVVLGTIFLGVKVIEYKQKFDHHLIPGAGFDIRYHAEHLRPPITPAKLPRRKKSWKKHSPRTRT